MYLYARVNILDGKAVRLPHGDISEVLFLDADPVERARGWVAKGADRLHVVDLDAAAHADYRNRPLISDLIDAVGVPVSVGGGVRSAQEVQRILDAGADKVPTGGDGGVHVSSGECPTSGYESHAGTGGDLPDSAPTGNSTASTTHPPPAEYAVPA